MDTKTKTAARLLITRISTWDSERRVGEESDFDASLEIAREAVRDAEEELKGTDTSAQFMRDYYLVS